MPQVPKVHGGILKAWRPWSYMGAAFGLLSEPSFAADDPLWPVHYYATINFGVSTFETLRNADMNNFGDRKEIFRWYFAERRKRRDSRFPDPVMNFVEVERNSFHHRNESQVKEVETARRPFLWDGDPSEIDHGIALEWSAEREDPLRLLSLAIQRLEADLRVIDQAMYTKTDLDPFGNWAAFRELEKDSYDRIETTNIPY